MRIGLRTWEVRLGLLLVASSVTIYGVKYLLLGDPENTYQYIFNALGFLPINVLLVTLLINELLSVRAKRDRLNKLNMVIGTFFSEVGTGLLTYLSDRDPNLPKIRHDLVVTNAWTPERFSKVRGRLRRHTCMVAVGAADLQELCRYLKEQRGGFLLRLLENPVLLEHESFTDLLRAVFHLTEELERRGGTSPDSRQATSNTSRETSNGCTADSSENGSPTWSISRGTTRTSFRLRCGAIPSTRRRRR